MNEAPPVRVLLACDRLGYDNARIHGAGRLMIQWTHALVEQGTDVTTVILRSPGQLGRQVLDEGLPFVFLSRHPYDPRTRAQTDPDSPTQRRVPGKGRRRLQSILTQRARRTLGLYLHRSETTEGHTNLH